MSKKLTIKELLKLVKSEKSNCCEQKPIKNVLNENSTCCNGSENNEQNKGCCQ